MGIEHQVIRDGAVLLICLGACVSDVRTRRIPNWFTFGGAVAGIAFSAWAGGFWGSGESVAGWAVCAGLMLPWFALGGMGAGDVKLVAAVGAWLGPYLGLWVVLYSAVAGGILAVFVSLAHGYLGTALRNTWSAVGFWRFAGIRPIPGLTLAEGKGPRLPYALPIAVGTVVTLWLR